MRILFLSVELAPWWKVGGLADVAAALPRALAEAGHEIAVAVPRHRGISQVDALAESQARGATGRRCEVFTPQGPRTVLAWDLVANDEHPRLLWIDAPEFFERGAVYGAEDDAVRFAFFTRAALVAAEAAGFAPDIVHANDWHTALAPVELERSRRSPALAGAACVLTLHNAGYAGTVDDEELAAIGLDPAELGDEERIDGRVALLAVGIRRADALTTVSPTYARELLRPEQGSGLERILRQRADDLVGILNGVDTRVWNPASDPHLPANYTSEETSGKQVCRRELLAELGLAPDPTGPVLGMISRLVWQKGIELLPQVLPAFLRAADTRVVVLGRGEADCMRFLAELAESSRGRLAFVPGEREPLAHRIEAGCDLFLMPSRYEPCGLNQMYSQLYGTLPVAHATGGLVDTIEDMEAGGARGTGFLFSPFSAERCLEALGRALRLFADRRAWLGAVQRVMRLDRSWTPSGREYVRLYERVIARRGRTDARSRPST